MSAAGNACVSCRFSALKPPRPELPGIGLATALWPEGRSWGGEVMERLGRTGQGHQGGRGRMASIWVGWVWARRQLQAKVKKCLPGSLAVCVFQTD